MNGDVKAQLILTIVETLINKGLPAVVHLTSELNKKDVVTIKDIEAVKSGLDSEKYFE